MKKINLLYLAIIPVLILGFKIAVNLNQNTVLFYGFTENKETQLSHEKAIAIHKVYVKPGELVSKGQLLIEVTQTAVDFKINDVAMDLEMNEATRQFSKQDTKNTIAQLKAEKLAKINSIDLQIKSLETSINFQKSLVKDLQTIKISEVDAPLSADALRLEDLKKEKEFAIIPFDLQIKTLENLLFTQHSPASVKSKKLEREIDYYKEEQQKLTIVAASDGIIGNIYCKEGETIASFSPLATFYERHPTQIKGFIHENSMLNLQLGDQLSVTSSLQPKQIISGKVVSIGARIIEMPERLRKRPDIKSYGREVLVEIPVPNPFLQQEKVMIQPIHKEGFDISLVDIFNSFRHPNKNRNNREALENISLK